MSMGSEQIDFNASDWANQANSFLSDALMLGLPYSERFTQEAIDATKDAQKQANAAQEAGYQKAQALDAPQRLAGYNALDSYLDTLSVARPEMGSFKLANALESAAQREKALTDLGIEVGNVQDYQNIRDLGSTVVDPVTGKETYMPGIYAENMLKMAKDMKAGNWFPSTNTSAGYVPLNSLQGGYLPLSMQRAYGGMSGSLPGQGSNQFQVGSGSLPQVGPMSAMEQTDQTIKDLQGALSDYNRATQYYTPEQGAIASSFNKGLLSTPQWANVNQPVYDPVTGTIRSQAVQYVNPSQGLFGYA